jgi:hypothetical protein
VNEKDITAVERVALTTASLLVGESRQVIADTLEKFSRRCYESGLEDGRAAISAVEKERLAAKGLVEIVERVREVLKFQDFTHEIITDGWGRDRHAEGCSVCELNKALAAYTSTQGQGNG